LLGSVDSSEGRSPLVDVIFGLPSSIIFTFFTTFVVTGSLISGSVFDDYFSKVMRPSYSSFFASSHGFEAESSFSSPSIASSELLLKRNRLEPAGYFKGSFYSHWDLTFISDPCPFRSCALENVA